MTGLEKKALVIQTLLFAAYEGGNPNGRVLNVDLAQAHRDLVAGNKSIRPATLFSLRPLSSTTKFTDTTINADNVLTNIDKEKSDRSDIFFIDEIKLLSVVAADETAAKAAKFTGIENLNSIQNGTLDLFVNKNPVLEKFNLESFVTTGMQVPRGSFQMATPIIIERDVELKIRTEIAGAIEANSWGKIVLTGLRITAK